MKYKNYKYIKYLTLQENLRYSSFVQHLLSMNKALGINKQFNNQIPD